MARLFQSFFLGDTVQIAQNLLGKYLVRRLEDGTVLIGRITETEAYIGRCDKACHAYNYRKTARTSTLFAPPGTAYVYLIYGMYDCLNFVTEPEGEPAAVLLRAVEPVQGVEAMEHLRYGGKELTPYRRRQFLNGPGKVCKAFAITRAQNGLDLTSSEELYLCDSVEGISLPEKREIICCGPRVGVDYAEEAKDFPWRFWLKQED